MNIEDLKVFGIKENDYLVVRYNTNPEIEFVVKIDNIVDDIVTEVYSAVFASPDEDIVGDISYGDTYHINLIKTLRKAHKSEIAWLDDLIKEDKTDSEQFNWN